VKGVAVEVHEGLAADDRVAARGADRVRSRALGTRRVGHEAERRRAAGHPCAHSNPSTCFYQPIAKPDVERLSREWDELARGDALWEVLSDPGRSDRRWQLDEFFASGELEVASALEQARRLGRPEWHARALDFGCGVGRLTRALSGRFSECVGVDVSEQMVERARKLNADRPNLEFVVNVAPNLAAFESGSFDLVFSSKVLQHMPSGDQACAYIAEFLRLVGPGGIAVFQLWTGIPLRNRIQPRRRAYGLLRRAGIPEARLNRMGLSPRGRGIAVREERIRRLAEEKGYRVAHTEPDGEWGLRYYVVAE
jgi:SAM-dependent methyltransferase